MRIDITRIGSVESFSARLEPGVALLEGDNAAGKSTVAACLAACLSREADPLSRGAARLNSYVMRGEAAGSASAALSGDGWRIEWRPGGGFAVSGIAPQCPRMAVLDPPEKGRAAWLEAIRPDPLGEDELTEEIARIIASRETAAKYAAEILLDEPRSWDVFNGRCQDRRRRAKSDWEAAVATVGESATYGARIAPGWTPPGWTADHEALTPAGCEREVTRAAERLRLANRAAAEIESAAEALRRWLADAEQLDERRVRLAARASAAPKPRPESAAEMDAAAQALRDADAESGRLREAAEAARAEAGAAQAAAQKAASAESAASDELRRLKSLLRHAEAAVASAHTSASDAESAIGALEAQPADCPTCGQPWDLRASGIAVDLAEKKRLLGEATAEALRREAAIPQKVEAVADAEAALKAAEAALKAAEAESGRLRKAAQAAEAASRAAAGAVAQCAAEHAAVVNRAAAIDGEIAAAERVRGELGELDRRIADHRQLRPSAAGRDETEAAAAEIDAAQSALDEARAADRLLRARRDAEAAHGRAAEWSALADLTSDTMRGLRARRLKSRVEKISEWASRVAPWCELEIVAGPSLRVRGAHIDDCSAGERWAAYAALRVTVAVMRSAPACVIDGADVLSGTYQPDLLRRIDAGARSAGVPVLVTRTVAGAPLACRPLGGEAPQ